MEFKKSNVVPKLKSVQKKKKLLLETITHNNYIVSIEPVSINT